MPILNHTVEVALPVELSPEERLAAQKEIHYQEMRTMREQIRAVENLRKAADRLERPQQNQDRKRTTSYEIFSFAYQHPIPGHANIRKNAI